MTKKGTGNSDKGVKKLRGRARSLRKMAGELYLHSSRRIGPSRVEIYGGMQIPFADESDRRADLLDRRANRRQRLSRIPYFGRFLKYLVPVRLK